MSDDFILAKKVKIDMGATGSNAVKAINKMDAEKRKNLWDC